MTGKAMLGRYLFYMLTPVRQTNLIEIPQPEPKYSTTARLRS